MTTYASDSTKTIEDLLLPNWDASDGANAPFIRIGNLLLAVDQTGIEAWRALVKNLMTNDNKDSFKIYSGRHGALEGCFVADGTIPPTAKHEKFFTDDEEEVEKLKDNDEFANVTIKARDCGSWDLETYKNEVSSDLNDGHVVIVSWCHSIASVLQHPEGANPTDYTPGSDLYKAFMKNRAKTVNDIVSNHYDWM